MSQARWNSVTFISPLLMRLLILRLMASQFSVTGASSESYSLSELENDSIAEKGRLDCALFAKTVG